MHRALFLLTALLLSVAVLGGGPVAADARQTPNQVPARYIVTLHEGADPTGVAARVGAVPDHVYHHALKGFAGRLTTAQVARLEASPDVLAIEPDQIVSLAEQNVPTGVQRAFAVANASLDIDGADDYRVDVDVAVIDTGIDLDHPDLNVDVANSVNCATGGPFSSSCGSGGDDDNGHGSHVGGTIGALDNGIGVVGVAPGARLWAVKVLNSRGSGYMSWIVAGIDYVTANAAQVEVANMSLGCECTSTALNTAIANSVDQGIVYVVAAGNSDKDASTFSPANHPDVITVSALADFDGTDGGAGAATCRADQDDTLADFSNFGSKVEIAAPGVCILSTWPGGGYNTISGTSMASPHGAGAAAILASRNDPANQGDVSNIRQTLMNEGNFNWTDDSGDGIKEPLLDVSDGLVFNPVLIAGSGASPPLNQPPTASFTYTCTGLSCSFDGSGSSDSDGSLVGYQWDFGDDTTASGVTTEHTYASSGSRTVVLTVTDDDGGTNATSQVVSVSSEPPAEGITLSATGYKLRGNQRVDLAWSGASGTQVDVFRDGLKLTTTTNDGAFTDAINVKGNGAYTYKVCEAATTTCSNEVEVVFS